MTTKIGIEGRDPFDLREWEKRRNRYISDRLFFRFEGIEIVLQIRFIVNIYGFFLSFILLDDGDLFGSDGNHLVGLSRRDAVVVGNSRIGSICMEKLQK